MTARELVAVPCTVPGCPATTTAEANHAARLAAVWRCADHYRGTWPSRARAEETSR